ncbi:hypothetical protein C8T65DRAFT_84128 [Cerioporus squamosus]|nr:hypothetical protein C8T65DRAFT_84128 [Cerioporus squamosus]
MSNQVLSWAGCNHHCDVPAASAFLPAVRSQSGLPNVLSTSTRLPAPWPQNLRRWEQSSEPRLANANLAMLSLPLLPGGHHRLASDVAAGALDCSSLVAREAQAHPSDSPASPTICPDDVRTLLLQALAPALGVPGPFLPHCHPPAATASERGAGACCSPHAICTHLQLPARPRAPIAPSASLLRVRAWGCVRPFCAKPTSPGADPGALPQPDSARALPPVEGADVTRLGTHDGVGVGGHEAAGASSLACARAWPSLSAIVLPAVQTPTHAARLVCGSCTMTSHFRRRGRRRASYSTAAAVPSIVHPVLRLPKPAARPAARCTQASAIGAPSIAPAVLFVSIC